MSNDSNNVGDQFSQATKQVKSGIAKVLDSDQFQRVRDFFQTDTTFRGIAISAIGSALVLGAVGIMDATDGTYELDLEVAASADGCPVTSTIHQQLNPHMLKNEGVSSAQGYMVFQMDDGETIICETSYGPESGAHQVDSIPESFASGPGQ